MLAELQEHIKTYRLRWLSIDGELLLFEVLAETTSVTNPEMLRQPLKCTYKVSFMLAVMMEEEEWV